ncbi:MAG: single-stranded DNA-binding protein [Chlamydiales bacterium]|nr:single-stranded DNA-binding protein [Chlamydiales bacterium]
MNQITIAGRLGNDPEVRYTSSGMKVIAFRVATNSRRGGKDDTIWYRVTIWGEQFDKMLPYIKKGTALIITGELGKPEIYNDREGNPQVSLNVTAFHITFSPFGSGGSTTKGSVQENHKTSSEQESEAFATAQTHGQADNIDESFSDEEIPF